MTQPLIPNAPDFAAENRKLRRWIFGSCALGLGVSAATVPFMDNPPVLSLPDQLRATRAYASIGNEYPGVDADSIEVVDSGVDSTKKITSFKAANGQLCTSVAEMSDKPRTNVDDYDGLTVISDPVATCAPNFDDNPTFER